MVNENRMGREVRRTYAIDYGSADLKSDYEADSEGQVV